MGEETDLVLLYVDPAIIGHGGIETKIADSLDGFKKPVIMISQFGTTPVPWSFILGGIVASMRLEHAGSDLVAA